MNHPGITVKTEIVKIFLPALLAIVLFIVAIFGFALPILKKNLIEQKKKQITVLTQTVWNILAYYDTELTTGHISRDYAHKHAMEQIKHLRYGPEGKDYFWINDLHPYLLMHPYLPEMEGKDVSDFVEHSGKLIFKEFVAEVEENDESFVPYLWQWNDNPQRISQKLSYIKLFKPWGWIIGTGVYLDDVYNEIGKVTRKFIYSSIIILLTVTLLLTLLVHQSIKNRRERVLAEEKIKEYQTDLEELVEKRTMQLQIEKERLHDSQKQFRSLQKPPLKE